MSYIDIPVKDNSTPLSPTEFNYLVDKLNTRRIRDLVDVNDLDPQDKNIIQHNGSGWVYYTINDDFYTKEEINYVLGYDGGGALPQLSVEWGSLTGTIRDQADLVANFGDLKAVQNIWNGKHYAENYILNGSTPSETGGGNMDSFFVSDGTTDSEVFNEDKVTIEGDAVTFDETTNTFVITSGIGDMSRAVYDFDNNGFVDRAERIVYTVTNHSAAKMYKGDVISPDVDTEITLATAYNKEKSRLIAMLDEDLEVGQSGVAVRLGKVSGIDTTGFVAGEKAHLSVDGQITPDEPDSRGYHVLVGVIEIADPVSGAITIDTITSTEAVEQSNSNGFTEEERDNTIISVDNSTRTFTIAATSYPFYFYNLSSQFDKFTSESVVFPDTEGQKWFYYERDVLKVVDNPTSYDKYQLITKHTLIAYIYWNATDKKVEFDIFDERHGFEMSSVTHAYLHATRGAQWNWGLGLSDIIIDSGSLNSHAQFTVDAGMMFDEDLSHNSLELLAGTTIPVAYLDGADGNFRVAEQAGYAFLSESAGGAVLYNNWNGTIWETLPLASGDLVLMHLYGINGNTKQVISVMGQNSYTNATDAGNGATNEIANIQTKLQAEEAVALGTVLIEYKTSLGNDVHARIIADSEGNSYSDWRTTELSTGSASSSHSNLSDVERAGTGISRGHIDNGFPIQLPELTTIERDAITPNNGMYFYNTTTGKFEQYTNGEWGSGDIRDFLPLSAGETKELTGGLYIDSTQGTYDLIFNGNAGYIKGVTRIYGGASGSMTWNFGSTANTSYLPVTPNANNLLDLGSDTLKWKDGYFAGTLNSNKGVFSELTNDDPSLTLSGSYWGSSKVVTQKYLYDYYSPLVEYGTAFENLVAGDIVYAKEYDPATYNYKWAKASASNIDAIGGELRVVNYDSNPSAGQTGKFSIAYWDIGTGYTNGDLIYLSETAGAYTNVAPTGAGSYVRVIGVTTNSGDARINTVQAGYIKADGTEVNGVSVGTGFSGASNITGDTISFKNPFGTFLQDSTTPVTSSIQLDLTDALNGAIGCVYYKAAALVWDDPASKIVIKSLSAFIPNELCLVWFVYDTGADEVHVNVQSNSGVAAEVPLAPSLTLTKETI